MDPEEGEGKLARLFGLPASTLLGSTVPSTELRRPQSLSHRVLSLCVALFWLEGAGAGDISLTQHRHGA